MANELGIPRPTNMLVPQLWEPFVRIQDLKAKGAITGEYPGLTPVVGERPKLPQPVLPTPGPDFSTMVRNALDSIQEGYKPALSNDWGEARDAAKKLYESAEMSVEDFAQKMGTPEGRDEILGKAKGKLGEIGQTYMNWGNWLYEKSGYGPFARMLGRWVGITPEEAPATEAPAGEAPAEVPPSSAPKQTRNIQFSAPTIDYSKGVSDIAFPAAPDYAPVRSAMERSAPGAYEDQPYAITDKDKFNYLLRGLAGAQIDPGSPTGFNIANLALAGLGGKASMNAEKRRDLRAHAGEERAYNRDLANLESQLIGADYSHRLKETEFNVGQDEKRRQAQLQNDIALQPTIGQGYVVQKSRQGPQTIYDYTQILSPKDRLTEALLGGGSTGDVPASAFNMQSLLGSLPPQLLGPVTAKIAALAQDKDIITIAATSSAGAKQAEALIISKLLGELTTQAQAGDRNALAVLQAMNSGMRRQAAFDMLGAK